jgi:NAD+ kinase
VQLIVEVSVGSDLYVRLAGDGIVVATPLGSSAYSMATGGSLLLDTVKGFICTPIAMHGGCAPPVVIPGDGEVTLDVDRGHGTFGVDVDGHAVDSIATRFVIRMQDAYATLVGFADADGGLSVLRGRGLISDSPRVLARLGREAARVRRAEPSRDRPGATAM